MEVVVLNCWVTETNDTGAVDNRQAASPPTTGQPIDLIDHDHVDLAGPDVVQEPLQGRPVGIAA
jgi:hypothetical protein